MAGRSTSAIGWRTGAGLTLPEAAQTLATTPARILGLPLSDDGALEKLFLPDSYWRDVVALSWTLQTIAGRDGILKALKVLASHATPSNFAIDPGRTPPRKVTRAGSECIEAIFRFETKTGRGDGIIRLAPDAADGHRLKAWTLLTALQELKGFEEQLGATRPRGQVFSRDFRGPNWQDLRNAASAYADRDPTVLIVGGGQAGLATAARLKHSSGYMVGLGLKSRQPGGGTPSTKSWMYFPEDNCPFYRVTYLSNYSPFMTPDKDNYYSLLCEVSESDAKPTPGRGGQDKEAVIEDCIRGLENTGLLEPGERANIVSRWCYYADYSYPTPSVERDEILADVIPYLESHDIYSRGRFGMWKYEVSNTDHTLMQGVELIDRLLLNKPETTIGMEYRVTEDGRRGQILHPKQELDGSGI